MKNSKFIKSILFFFPVLGITFLYSCSNDLETVNALPEKSSKPLISEKEVYMERTDSGKIKIRAYAPEFSYFNKEDNPYTEFPKGIKVESFVNFPEIESSITADYAIFHENSKVWEAKNNVMVTNSKGDTLNTELLFFDQIKEIIYTNKFCRVRTEDGILFGKNGFEADQYFTRWKLKNTKGTVNVKDE